MKKAGALFLLLCALCVVLTVGAFASGEPGGGPSAEPMAAAGETSFDVAFLVNGEEFKTVDVGVAVNGGEYTFRVSRLLDLLGVRLSYDEEDRVLAVIPGEEGVAATLLASVGAAGKTLRAAPDAVMSRAMARARIERSSRLPAGPAGGETTLLPADIRNRPIGSLFRSVS